MELHITHFFSLTSILIGSHCPLRFAIKGRPHGIHFGEQPGIAVLTTNPSQCRSSGTGIFGIPINGPHVETGRDY
jgi:hypothetical protein